MEEIEGFLVRIEDGLSSSLFSLLDARIKEETMDFPDDSLRRWFILGKEIM